jgi:1,4-alpha-glucan branching enzyme
MIKKRAYKNVVRVTFELPGDAVNEHAGVAGSFNDWTPSDLPMEYVKTRDVWKAAVSLEPDSTYEFKYRVDGDAWLNDPEADDYASNPYVEKNSVVHT